MKNFMRLLFVAIVLLGFGYLVFTSLPEYDAAEREIELPDIYLGAEK